MSRAPEIDGPEPLTLAGRSGVRYRIRHPHNFVDDPAIDHTLSSYPLVVFTPARPSAHTPIVIGLQGMAVPYHWSDFLVPHLVDRGIACVLFDTPLAGERSLVRDAAGDMGRQLHALVERGANLSIQFVQRLFEATACDFNLVCDLLRTRHGLTSDRVALFGISLGCLLASLAFTRDGHGQRLLGVIGHADLGAFARSYVQASTATAPTIQAFVAILRELGDVSAIACSINAMTYADRLDASRVVRFLVGRDDPILKAEDAVRCARSLPNGDCYVVPGMSHGETTTVLKFEDHVRYFLATQLSDWTWEGG